MKSYQCGICRYLYDPEQGDPENNIPPPTSFEQLPADWVCPICAAAKEQFSPLA